MINDSYREKDQCLIFDVDNVLINTDNSFPWVIRTSIQWLWRFYLKKEVDCIAFTWLHFHTIKTFPQFNDDYDIAWFLINAAASKGEPSLEKSFPDIPELQSRLSQFTGNDIEQWVDNNFSISVPRSVTRKLCAELYYGSFQFKKITGKEPSMVRCSGFWRREQPNIQKDWKSFPLPVGIYTGRYKDELDLALKLLGWEDFPMDHAVTGDSGITKPSPQGLSLLCKRLGRENPLYFGDAESDRKSMKNLGYGTFIAIGDVLKDHKNNYPDLSSALSDLGML